MNPLDWMAGIATTVAVISAGADENPPVNNGTYKECTTSMGHMLDGPNDSVERRYGTVDTKR